MEALLSQSNVISGQRGSIKPPGDGAESVDPLLSLAPPPDRNLSNRSVATDTTTPPSADRLSSYPEAFDRASRTENTSSHFVTLNLSCDLGAFPASSIAGSLTSAGRTDDRIYHHTRPQYRDLVSQRLIPLETAESLFCFYRDKLDPHIHNALLGVTPSGQHQHSPKFPTVLTLSTIRSMSSLLTAAVCTTAAFCGSTEMNKHYQTCLDAFTQEICHLQTLPFQRKVRRGSNHSFDDVRALCIGAFWLPQISSELNALGKHIFHSPSQNKPFS